MCISAFKEVGLVDSKRGFTLIELSIVLVIIGLIVGGVLVGQDLIRAAYIRAQITQIEKFNAAVNTFYGKFQALPGDMNNQTALAYGFSTATHNGAGGVGAGNGDGIIQSWGTEDSVTLGTVKYMTEGSTAGGETGVFWVDLSSAVGGNLIEGGFTSAVEGSAAFTTLVPKYVPAAKIGGGNYVYITQIDGVNYYGIQLISTFFSAGAWLAGSPGMTVIQAYNIDRKVDDGYPTTGTVAAMFSGHATGTPTGGMPVWSIQQTGGLTSDSYIPAGSLFSGQVASAGNTPDKTTCFDAPLGSPPTYSTEISGGGGVNCALIFKMQGGD
jgi:prepilin-type N-terminal cleavage/methylation domain-containing protein